MTMLLAVLLSAVTGFLISTGVYDFTQSFILQLVIGIPLVIVNSILLTRGMYNS